MSPIFVLRDVSQYGSLTDHAEEFRTLHDSIAGRAASDDPCHFTAAAWKTADVEWTAERLVSIEVTAGWESWLIVDAQVAVPRPEILHSLGVGFSDWTRPSRPGDTYEGPNGAYMDRPAMLTSTRLTWRVDVADLHAPQDTPEALTARDARASVERLAALLDERIAPVLAALDPGPTTKEDSA